MSLTQQAKDEVERFLKLGQKLMAVKYLRDTFQLTIEEAKRLVEAVEREMIPQSSESLPPQSPEARAEIERLLRAGQKMEAIKYVRKQFGYGLKEALGKVELVEREVNPNFTPLRSGCAKNIFRLVGGFLGIVGILFLLGAWLVYYFQSEIVHERNKTDGMVIELRSKDGLGSEMLAPLIAYEWKGKDYQHQSTFYSNPPDFGLDEKVTLFVNPGNPEEIIIDTFSERWLAIVILGGVGVFAGLIGFIFIFVSRRF